VRHAEHSPCVLIAHVQNGLTGAFNGAMDSLSGIKIGAKKPEIAHLEIARRVFFGAVHGF
jgi:hypothetical protein